MLFNSISSIQAGGGFFDRRECTMLCFVLIFSYTFIIYLFVYVCSHAHTTGCV